LKHALEYQEKRDLRSELKGADLVLVRVIDDFGAPSPIHDPTFIQVFGSEPVYEIVRGRGVYRMTVIQIYKRREMLSHLTGSGEDP
jgi:hypothetical protein